MAALRDRLGKDMNLLKEGFFPLWVIDFPLFEFDYEKEKWNSRHHPFTSPKDGDESALFDNPGKAMAKAYDLTLNGVEIGGGSIRIHSYETQIKILSALGIDK